MEQSEPQEESNDPRSWGCLNRLIGALLIWFGFSLGVCAAISGAAGIYLFFTGEKDPAIFPILGAALLLIGTLYFLVLGVIGLFRPIPLETSNSDEPERGDRIIAALFGGFAGVLLGIVGGVFFTITGDWKSGVSCFGNAIFILSLLSYAFPDVGMDLAGEIYRPAFRVAYWFIGRFS